VPVTNTVENQDKTGGFGRSFEQEAVEVDNGKKFQGKLE
jgi:hypothetical protein